MLNRPSLIAASVIAIHLAICLFVSWAIGNLAERVVFSHANTLAMLVAPAILLVCADRVSIVVRTICMIASLEAGRACLFETDDFPALIAFLFEVLAMAVAWRWIASMRLLTDRTKVMIPCATLDRQFSLKQLLTTTAAIALALATARLRWSKSSFAYLGAFTFEDWLYITGLAVPSFIASCGALLTVRLAIATSCVPWVVGIAMSRVMDFPFNGAWDVVLVFVLGGAIAELPFLIFRWCGWRWVWKMSQADESTAMVDALSAATDYGLNKIDDKAGGDG